MRTVLRLEAKTTHEQAAEHSARLGKLSLGVVPYQEGYAVRVKPDDIQTARSIVNTKATAVCGVNIMRAKTTDGHNFCIEFVPKAVQQLELCEILEDTIGFECRPAGVNTKQVSFPSALLTP